MVFLKKRFDLQLFADGGEGGGEGAAPSGEYADPAAGDARLRELGVPEAVLAKRADRRAKAAGVTAAAHRQMTAAAPAQQAAAAETDNAPEKDNREGANTDAPKAGENAPKRMSWDEIMADPEYNRQMKAMMQARFRETKKSEDALTALAPALDVLAKFHGIDTENMDYASLAEAISSSDVYFKDKSAETGKSVDVLKTEYRQEFHRREQERGIREQKIRDHIAGLERQGEALKAVYPQFELAAELQNPVFRRMTAPDSGLSVEDAYVAVHRKELMAAAMQVTAQRTAEQMARNIAAGQSRPVENGTSAQAPSNTTFDYANASREQREALKRQIREAAARGQKLYPGRI